MGWDAPKRGKLRTSHLRSKVTSFSVCPSLECQNLKAKSRLKYVRQNNTNGQFLNFKALIDKFILFIM